MFLAGLPAESAFVSEIHAEREEGDDWRSALGRATGRDYSRPTRRMSLEEFASSGGL